MTGSSSSSEVKSVKKLATEIFSFPHGLGKYSQNGKKKGYTDNPLGGTRYVKIAEKKSLLAAGTGTVVISKQVNEKFIERELQNVLVVPELRRNLFSIATINDKKFSFYAYGKNCEVHDKSGRLASRGERHGGLFKMLFQVKMPLQSNVAESKQTKLKLWHQRMGHVNI